MIYGYGGRVDNDSNAITIIDEENRTAETKGYVNGEYVEFSGGGSSDFSMAEVIVINEGEEASVTGPFVVINEEYDIMGIDDLYQGSNTVVLYKSSMIRSIPEIAGDFKIISMVGSGNVSVTERTGLAGKEYVIEITGNGSITVNAEWVSP